MSSFLSARHAWVSLNEWALRGNYSTCISQQRWRRRRHTSLSKQQGWRVEQVSSYKQVEISSVYIPVLLPLLWSTADLPADILTDSSPLASHTSIRAAQQQQWQAALPCCCSIIAQLVQNAHNKTVVLYSLNVSYTRDYTDYTSVSHFVWDYRCSI